MKAEVQMKHALAILKSFDCKIPLSFHLKKYFRHYRNAGSKDRKILASLSFQYFRLKGAYQNIDMQNTIIQASANDDLLSEFYLYWANKNGFEFKDFALNKSESEESYFPLQDQLSSQLDITSFLESHRQQPKTFIHIHSTHFEDVKSEAELLHFQFQVEEENCISFSNHYALEQMKSFEKGYFEIQDISSQQLKKFLRPKHGELWWDCCAGSGGKSILLSALQKNIQLTVSDLREPILENLKMRFNKRGIINYYSYCLDLTQEEELNHLPDFDNIIADLPCSGTGTWSRTPEWLSFFTERQLQTYSDKQKNIVKNITKKLKSGGILYYCTCSVYAEENEKNVEWFCKHLSLKKMHEYYFQYSKKNGDTLFVAVLEKV